MRVVLTCGLNGLEEWRGGTSVDVETTVVLIRIGQSQLTLLAQLSWLFLVDDGIIIMVIDRRSTTVSGAGSGCRNHLLAGIDAESEIRVDDDEREAMEHGEQEVCQDEHGCQKVDETWTQ